MAVKNKSENEDFENEFTDKKLEMVWNLYQDTRNDFIDSDNKIIQLVIFNGVLLGFFLQFVNFPNSIWGRIIYFSLTLLIFITFVVLLNKYSPKKIEIVKIDSLVENSIFKKGSYITFKNQICNELKSSNRKIREIIQNKTKTIKLAYILILMDLVLISILKIWEGVF